MTDICKQKRPPVPKFNSSLQPDSSKTYFESTMILKSFKKKLTKIFRELTKQISNLPLKLQNSHVEERAIKFLTPQVLDSMKSKKYELVAKVVLTHYIGVCYDGKELRKFIDNQSQSENTIKILAKLHKERLINAGYLVHIKLNQINVRLGLNDKFSETCDDIQYILTDLGFYNPFESINLNAAIIIKIVGDIVFMSKGGVNIDMIQNYSTCSEQELINQFNAIRPYFPEITQQIIHKQKEKCLSEQQQC